MALRPVIQISVCEDAPTASQRNEAVNNTPINSPNGGSSPSSSRDALYNAAKSASLKDVREVLTSAAISKTDRYKMVEYTDPSGKSALHIAAQEGKVRIVLLILEHDSFLINKQDADGNTACHLAMKAGKEGMVIWLIKKGADVQLKNKEGKSVIDLASPKVLEIVGLIIDLQRVKEIVENPATNIKRCLDDRGLYGKNPLHIAVENGNTELVRYLLHAGADPNREEEYMNVPLTISVTCYNGSPELARLLIEFKAEINTKSMFGLVPLIIASENGILDLVSLLIESGADINAVDNAGNTALHLAVQEGHAAVVQFLLAKGANISLKNESNQTVMDAAIPNIKKLLCEYLGIEFQAQEAVTSVVDKAKFSSDVPLPAEQIFEMSQVKLGEKLGSGSYGTVYLATWKDKTVALKMTQQQNPAALRMIKAEISALKGVSHENVIKFYAASLSQKSYCFINELANHGSLNKLMQKKGTLELSEILHFASGIAKGMQYLHEIRRVVHRDLRADNILLHEEDSKLIPKISDFGLACDVPLLNKRGQMKVGSLRWMSPEVYGGSDHLTTKIDVYSYGILLWEMMACDVPFFTESPLHVAKLAAEENRRPEIPSSFSDSIVADIAQKCWVSDVDTRPSFAQVIVLLTGEK